MKKILKIIFFPLTVIIWFLIYNGIFIYKVVPKAFNDWFTERKEEDND